MKPSASHCLCQLHSPYKKLSNHYMLYGLNVIKLFSKRLKASLSIDTELQRNLGKYEMECYCS